MIKSTDSRRIVWVGLLRIVANDGLRFMLFYYALTNNMSSVAAWMAFLALAAMSIGLYLEFYAKSIGAEKS